MIHTLDLLIRPGANLGTLALASGRAAAVLALALLLGLLFRRRPGSAARVVMAGLFLGCLAAVSASVPAGFSILHLRIPRADMLGSGFEQGVLVLWAVGVAVGTARFFGLVAARDRLWRNAAPASDDLTAAVSRHWPGEGGLEVRVGPVGGAMIAGERPVTRLLLAEEAEHLTPEELGMMLHHEAAHARGRDARVRTMAGFASVFLWPLPVVHLVRRALVSWQEIDADRSALVATGQEPGTYARLLYDFWRGEGRAAAPSFASGSLAQRMRQLGRTGSRSRSAEVVAIAGLLVATVISASVSGSWYLTVAVEAPPAWTGLTAIPTPGAETGHQNAVREFLPRPGGGAAPSTASGYFLIESESESAVESAPAEPAGGTEASGAPVG